MTDAWETSLPKSLQTSKSIDLLKNCVTQWSRLVSWSWTDVPAYKDDPTKAEEEKVLKTFLISILQKQGQATYAYQSYGDDDSKQKADALSGIIKSLFIETSYSGIEKLEKVGITLSDILVNLSGEGLSKDQREFFKLFTFRIVVDYTGTIEEIGLEDRSFDEPPYVAYFAYPPRPALGECTVTEQQLSDWATNKNTGGDYLPPSIYIPIAST